MTKKTPQFNVLKNELVIARTSFELAKKYKELAQAVDSDNVDENAILPFYIFTSFSHLNHCMVSIRKILFDKDSRATPSLEKVFSNKSTGEWCDSQKKFKHLDGKYKTIKDDINKVAAHINGERLINSVSQIFEQRIADIESLLNDTVELFNTLPVDEYGLLPEQYGAFQNVLFGFDTFVASTKNSIENKRFKK